ncbi:restriction endonuclease subunit S [Candidatus Clostridium helianthi]|uniref:Restriction endonuclease subunit S n=1 Tax=Candidatus Clostridium helianthi TaxID=3381660 RepID=A0ABW8S9X7_9CLOT
MNAQDLKNSILQLAIQGKLVEQRQEEGNAKELIKEIKAEKERLIKEKKIKKEKPLAEIAESDIPFEIPESWEWVRLSDVIDVRDGTHDTPRYVTEGIPLVTSKNLINGTIDFDNVKLISFEDAEKINKRSNVDNGDILFAMIGSIGNPVLVKKDREFSIKNMALFKTININLFNMEYLFWYLEKEQDIMKKKATGGVQSFVSLSFLRAYLIPIPPLAEQKRIVAKIEDLMPYIEKYGTAHSKLEAFNKKFPEDMQKSILQYAIQGKLVEQREEDGTAEELYKKIQEEKEKLVKEKKIKKEKPLAEITDDEVPFEIPESWKWVRLGNLFSVSTGLTPAKTNPLFHENGDIPWITSSQTGELKIEKANNFITKFAIENTNIKIYPKHTLLIAMYGQGKTRGQISELLIDATINQACAALENIVAEENLRKYILYFQIYNYDVSRTGAEGSAQPNLNLDKVRNILVPLPPLEEQKRIVAKIEEMLPYCQQLVK